MTAPRVMQQEWHKNEWWPYGEGKPHANQPTQQASVILMVTTQPWTCEAEQPGVRTDKTKLRYKVHLR